MKKLLILCNLFFSLLAQASTTAVTATVTDVNSQAYAYGTVTATFRPTPGVPGPYSVDGVNFPRTVTASLDNAGLFTMTLTSNTSIQPANSRWTFTVCSSASVQCFDSVQNVTGASQNLSAAISANSIPITNISALPGLTRAYQDSQVSGGFGTIYYNIDTNTIKVNNGTLTAPNWVDVGGGSSGVCGSDTEVQYNDAGSCGASAQFTFHAPGSIVLGDGTGSPSFTLNQATDIGLGDESKIYFIHGGGAGLEDWQIANNDNGVAEYEWSLMEATDFTHKIEVHKGTNGLLRLNQSGGNVSIGTADGSGATLDIGIPAFGGDALHIGGNGTGVGITCTTTTAFPTCALVADRSMGVTAVPVLELVGNLGSSELDGNVIDLHAKDGGNSSYGSGLGILVDNTLSGTGAFAAYMKAHASSGNALVLELVAANDGVGDEIALAIDSGSIQLPDKVASAFSIAAGTTTQTIADSYVTVNSQIFIVEDSTLGARLGVTCNTTLGRTYAITTRTAGTSFVVTASAAPVVNPACLSYFLVN